MLKVNDKIKVHLFNSSNREIQTRHFNTVFTVCEKNGKLGINWNTYFLECGNWRKVLF